MASSKKNRRKRTHPAPIIVRWNISALELGAHHGVMVLGFVNILSSLPDMLDGLTGTFLSDDEEEVEHTEDDSEDLPRQQEPRPPAPAEVEIKKAA